MLKDAELRRVIGALAPGREHQIDPGGCPGLKLRVKPSGYTSWSFRYRTATGERRVPLGRYPATTLASARSRARKLLGRVEAGEDPAAAVHRVEMRTLSDAVAGFLEAAAHRLKPKTMETYGGAIERLTTWATAAGVRSTEDLTRARLQDFRNWLIALPKAAPVRGGARGQRDATAERRGPLSVNRELRAVKTFLNELRRAGALPSLDRDAIADTLRALPAAREQPRYLAQSDIEKMLDACLRHDEATFTETREEHAGHRPPGHTPRYIQIAPFAAVVLLTGMRRAEALGLRWSDVDLDAEDHDGRRVGEIRLRAGATKTNQARTIGLEVSPALRRLLAALKLRTSSSGRVFGGYSPDLVTAARKRLINEYGAPDFTWQDLRKTCGTYLTNAPSIFGAAAPFMSARQLGHSVTIAEKHYAGVLRGIPRDAHTLDAAMRTEEQLAKITSLVATGPQLSIPRTA